MVYDILCCCKFAAHNFFCRALCWRTKTNINRFKMFFCMDRFLKFLFSQMRKKFLYTYLLETVGTVGNALK